MKLSRRLSFGLAIYELYVFPRLLRFFRSSVYMGIFVVFYFHIFFAKLSLVNIRNYLSQIPWKYREYKLVYSI